MKWKYWLLGGFLGISTASQAHEQYEEDSDSARTPKQETLAKIPGHSRPAYNAAEYNTDSLAPKRAASPADTVQTGTVSPRQQSASLPTRQQSISPTIHLLPVSLPIRSRQTPSPQTLSPPIRCCLRTTGLWPPKKICSC